MSLNLPQVPDHSEGARHRMVKGGPLPPISSLYREPWKLNLAAEPSGSATTSNGPHAPSQIYERALDYPTRSTGAPAEGERGPITHHQCGQHGIPIAGYLVQPLLILYPLHPADAGGPIHRGHHIMSTAGSPHYPVTHPAAFSHGANRGYHDTHARYHPYQPSAHMAPPPLFLDRRTTAPSQNAAVTSSDVPPRYGLEGNFSRLNIQSERHDHTAALSSATPGQLRASGDDREKGPFPGDENRGESYICPSPSPSPSIKARQQPELKVLKPRTITSEARANEGPIIARAPPPGTVQTSVAGPSDPWSQPAITHKTAAESRESTATKSKASTEFRFPCRTCKKANGDPLDFSRLVDVKRHLMSARVHAPVPAFKCKYCPVAFTRKETLDEHTERMHRNEIYDARGIPSDMKLEDRTRGSEREGRAQRPGQR
ncbi:hypothetical protein EW146_g6808 [Bondarzewia mesenterica]|uniref:C2H2-type domain-containing protein n=1 Tax=Bondarzewia mesenterica TaxID=1095465 RepID=A0A4S4LMH6_9AGAM|nr:hypothetical protein EW146_g6808 [Bondarzewia mesenterica]